ncbi:MFS transporter [Roseibium sp. M-1]
MSLALDGTNANKGKGKGKGKRWAALLALYLAMFMNVLDVSVVNLALPSIRQGLGATETELEWVIVVYVLAFAAGLLPFGRFGDVAGRDRVFRWGVAGFSLSSLACGLAPDIAVLITARAVQGFFAAMMVPQVLAIVHVLFQGGEKGKAIGLFGSVSALGAVAGPLVGGAVVAVDLFGLGWRPIFLMNLPIGVFSFLAALRFLPSLESDSRVRPDWPGTVLFTLAVLVLVFPLVEGRRLGWPIWCFALIGAGAVLAVLFFRQQQRNARRGRAQLLPVSLTRDRVFVSGLVFLPLFFSCLMGLFFMLAVLLQSGLGLSPMTAGLTLAPHPAGVILASVLTGRLGGRWLAQRLAIAALIVLGGLIAVRLALSGGAAPVALMLPLLVVGLGTGTAIPALFQLVLSRVAPTDAGAGSGALQAFQQVGMALGVAIQGQIFFQGLGLEAGEPAYVGAAMATLLYPIGVCGLLAVLCLIFVVRFSAGRTESSA